jgi:hypothetical protein
MSSIFIAENQPSKNPACSRWLGGILSSHMLHAGFLLGCFSTLKMEVIYYSEASIHIRTARHYVPEDDNIHKMSWLKMSGISGEIVERALKFNSNSRASYSKRNTRENSWTLVFCSYRA